MTDVEDLKIEDVDDAFAWAFAVRDAGEIFEQDHPGSVLPGKPGPPNPDRPGSAFLAMPEVVRLMEGGYVQHGTWDCARCGREFYMELAISAKDEIINSLGGVLFAENVALCDDCSPI